MARKTTKTSAKSSKSRRTAKTQKPSKGSYGKPFVLLLDPKFDTNEKGKITSITGTCSHPGCKEKRTIHLQDAFQVRFCRTHQLEAVKARRAEKARARREAQAAKAETRKRGRAKRDAKAFQGEAGKQVAQGLAEALKQ